jgi:hypothetical protein
MVLEKKYIVQMIQKQPKNLPFDKAVLKIAEHCIYIPTTTSVLPNLANANAGIRQC